MVSVIMLNIEILLDVLGLITGLVVIIRSSGKRMQRAWGILTLSLSSLLLYDNIEWIYLWSRGVEQIPRFTQLPLDHLSLWHIFRSVIFLQVYSLFPIATVKRGWLTASRAICLCIPAVLISCIAYCYEQFNSHYTTLESFNGIIKNLDHQDVIVRLVLFAVSVVAPTCNFLLPYFKGWVSFKDKQSKPMTFYIVSYGMIVLSYIWLMLGTTSLSFNMFGYIVILPCIYMNIVHLCSYDPLVISAVDNEVVAVNELESSNKEAEASPVVLELSMQLRTLMQEKAPFVDPGYSLSDLLEHLDTNENRLNKTLHYVGFSGFRDYINYHRLQYFKEQAVLNKELTVKELMFMSGFTSRSSFYRYFSSIEKMSPSEYMEALQKENSTKKV